MIMAKENSIKEIPVKTEGETRGIIFTCKFCGETKPFNELVLQTRYFPVLTSCRACDKALENLKLEGTPEEFESETAEEETEEEKTAEDAEE
jgi:hypothetical protein